MSQPHGYDLLETTKGWIGVLASCRGLLRVTVPRPTRNEAWRAIGSTANKAVVIPKAFEGLYRKLQLYLEGMEISFEEPLDLEDAPPFFRVVWEACRSIPRGQTRTYGELASLVGRPRASRAVGQAMARNPIAILIPCHRVIGKGGDLHGYGGGVEMKACLLKSEGWRGLSGTAKPEGRKVSSDNQGPKHDGYE